LFFFFNLLKKFATKTIYNSKSKSKDLQADFVPTWGGEHLLFQTKSQKRDMMFKVYVFFAKYSLFFILNIQG